MSSVAAVVIGNEVLSGKVVEKNCAVLIAECARRGIHLRGCIVVRDDVDAVVEAIGWARQMAGTVITSGGIGPTHDDVTVRAVACALRRNVVTHPKLFALARRWASAQSGVARVRLSEIPEGATLNWQPGLRYPCVECAGVWMLPGVPELFVKQLSLALRQVQASPLACGELYLRASEPDLAEGLDAVALAWPDVAIGSYPTWDAALDYRVRVTVENVSTRTVALAMADLRRQWPREWIVRSLAVRRTKVVA